MHNAVPIDDYYLSAKFHDHLNRSTKLKAQRNNIIIRL